MKLRLRSFETKETIKLEVPNPCTLQQLTQLLSQKLHSSSHPSSIHFSLNQKDELTTSTPEESIQSTGITSGDLIFFTTSPNKFSPSPQFLPPSPPKSQPPSNPLTKNPEPSTLNETLNPNPDETPESMEIDDDENYISGSGKSFSVPGFLRKVFTQELSEDNDRDKKILPIAVRAVLLESGFLEIDPVSNSPKSHNNNFTFLSSFHYTLPDLIKSGNIETIKIKFQKLGNFRKVYASLPNGPTHSVLLNEEKLVPYLNIVWANCSQEWYNNENRVPTADPEREVFEFWRKTKDEIALPLLIDLCEKTGLELPPCFIQLPTELKLKILENVSGVDVANVSCVCTELRYLGSSEDLWKEKLVSEYGESSGFGSFKERYVRVWVSRKKRSLRCGMMGRRNLMRIRNPYGGLGPGYFPPIRGGDYDVWMNVGNSRPRNSLLPHRAFQF